MSKIPGTDVIALRIANAYAHFIGLCTDRGFTQQEAEKIFEVYRKHKTIKLDAVNGRYNVKHGAFLDIDVMRNAVNL